MVFVKGFWEFFRGGSKEFEQILFFLLKKCVRKHFLYISNAYCIISRKKTAAKPERRRRRTFPFYSLISSPRAEESYIACIIFAVTITVSMWDGSFSPVWMQRMKELISFSKWSV